MVYKKFEQEFLMHGKMTKVSFEPEEHESPTKYHVNIHYAGKSNHLVMEKSDTGRWQLMSSYQQSEFSGFEVLFNSAIVMQAFL